jgi:hypothetical protein
MTNLIKILCALSLTAAAACGNSSSSTSGTTGGAGTTGGGTTTGGGIPAVPTLGTHEIDRMGRPAINTALTAPLNVFALPDGGTIAEPAAKDLYNQSSDPTMWTAQFQGAFAGSLAVYDGLDGTCGNQILAALPDAGGTNLSTYGTLAAVLTDDEIYVDTTVSACNYYLGVELEAIKVLPAGTDCGGRTPLENTIDETYSALAIGALTGVTNGVTSKTGGTANTTTFPFLGAPQ